ncbi:MAG: ABC transporter ATP-binding protein [Sphaerochaetaceae bacterium]|jgi:ATP-binding cassette subfamily C protein|nr:ABC transporter ATP-binding protein [Sphaerochaetaceae bacterium]
MKIEPSAMLKKLRAILSRRQKQKSLWLILLFMAMSLFQVVGVAAIFPFVNLVMDPTLLESNQLLGFLYQTFGFVSYSSFILFLGIALFVFIILSNAISGFTVWVRTRFVMGLNHELSTRLLTVYISKPYAYFLNKNTSTLGKNLLAEVYQLTNNMLIPIFELVVNTMVILTLVIVLFMTDFITTCVALAILGGSYAVINFRVKKRVKRGGLERLEANRGRYKITGEALSGIKTTKVFGRENYFIKQFSAYSKKFTQVETSVRTISEIPRYLLEALAFGGIILLVVFLTITRGGASDVIPLVSLFAFAGYRLLPAMQKVFQAATSIYFNQAILDTLHQDLTEDVTKRDLEIGEPIFFTKEIRLKNLSFSYPDTSVTVLANINLTIRKNSTVGFVGTTGSGKTTLVDILLGLLVAQEGGLFVDDVPLTSQRQRAWQQIIGYVPQDIFLSDDTVARNIAFGLADEKIESDKVQAAAKIAALDTFISEELAHGYETIIGERGLRLSGGQRQRIGLARALYENPAILVLDEATSSLDGVTETAVMKAINNASKDRTVIMIAHRLSTVRDCDVIYLMEKGSIVAHGTFVELMETNATFKNMAKQ